MAWIIDAMTPEERDQPEILDSSRKMRIAAPSEGTAQDVS